MKKVASAPIDFALRSIVSALMLSFGFYLSGLTAAAADNPHQPTELSEQEIEQIFDRGWWLLSGIHEDPNRLDEAIRLYQKVLAAAPDNKQIYWKLAEITFKKAETVTPLDDSIKMYQKSLSYARKAVTRCQDCFESHFWVGCSSARLAELYSVIRAAGIIDDAIDELELAISIDPRHRLATSANAILAAIYTQMPWPMRDLEKAERYATVAVANDPNLTLASLHLAQVYARKKEYTKAYGEINRCLSLEQPTYIWDAELYDWPAARALKSKIESELE